MRQYEINGVAVNCPTGFSFTALLFGPFVPLLRGDLKGAAINVVFHLLLIWTMGFGNLIWLLAFACMYNGSYEKDIRMKGGKLRGN